jgi:hypothetical protein
VAYKITMPGIKEFMVLSYKKKEIHILKKGNSNNYK